MDQYLVPRDETARRIDPEGILDAPDSPGTELQSPSKASRISFSPGSDSGEGENDLSGSDCDEENTNSAAKMIVERESEHDSSMDQDETDVIQPAQAA
jgi:hypothetical protein